MRDVAGAILADIFALYLKTKNFHAHERAPSAITTCCLTNRPNDSLP